MNNINSINNENSREDKFFRGVAEIDLSAIKRNALYLISLMPEGAQSVAVVKADAYGHGAREVCKALHKTVDAFAVATPEEAHEILSEVGESDIYILGYTRHGEFAFCVQSGVIPTIFSYEDALACSNIASLIGKSIRISIKVDTGMNRIGFAPSKESADTVARIASLPGIEIYSLFTHFACADLSNEDATVMQTGLFNNFISLCKSRGVSFKRIHSANSAATLTHRGVVGNQYRLGISLYGYSPSAEITPNIPLIPAMSFKSHVIFKKTIKKGEKVGYGHTFEATSDTEIATIPIGYADGYPRLLSNKGRILINGQSAKVVGRICMDMLMADVTGMNVSVGDEVVLLGKSGDLTVSADEIAFLSDTISYEILCGIGKRIPRRYKY
ncbi:MAG: alanine racemase [Clostridia bacterium]|nr:alanine racemase [Clostridia bacterium]